MQRGISSSSSSTSTTSSPYSATAAIPIDFTPSSSLSPHSNRNSDIRNNLEPPKVLSRSWSAGNVEGIRRAEEELLFSPSLPPYHYLQMAKAGKNRGRNTSDDAAALAIPFPPKQQRQLEEQNYHLLSRSPGSAPRMLHLHRMTSGGGEQQEERLFPLEKRKSLSNSGRAMFNGMISPQESSMLPEISGGALGLVIPNSSNSKVLSESPRSPWIQSIQSNAYAPPSALSLSSAETRTDSNLQESGTGLAGLSSPRMRPTSPYVQRLFKKASGSANSTMFRNVFADLSISGSNTENIGTQTREPSSSISSSSSKGSEVSQSEHPGKSKKERRKKKRNARAPTVTPPPPAIETSSHGEDGWSSVPSRQKNRHRSGEHSIKNPGVEINVSSLVGNEKTKDDMAGDFNDNQFGFERATPDDSITDLYFENLVRPSSRGFGKSNGFKAAQRRSYAVEKRRTQQKGGNT